VIDQFTSLLGALPRELPTRQRITGALPPDLVALIPLVDKWALGDDEARVRRVGT
jgi:hypothetical protein